MWYFYSIYLFLPLRRWKRRQELFFFTEQLISVMEENLSLVPSLEMIAYDIRQTGFRRIIRRIAEDIASGNSLYESLSRWRRVFSKLYLKMVDIGERNGNLPEVLRYLLNHFHRMDKFREKVREMWYYPGIPILYIIGVVSIFLKFVIPTFRQMFAEMEIELPATTISIMRSSEWLTENDNFIFFGLIMMVFCLGIIHLLGTKIKRLGILFDSLLLKVPISGALIRGTNVIRFSEILGTLLESGVPLDEALETISDVPMNRVFQATAKGMAGEVREGESLSSLLNRRNPFPATFNWMTTVGEGRGNLGESLLQVGNFYELRLNSALNRIVAIATPVLVLMEGAFVGYMAIGMLSPLMLMAVHLM